MQITKPRDILSLFLNVVVLAAVAEAIRVLEFQSDIWQPPSTRVFARYNFTQESSITLLNFSICYRLQLKSLMEGNVHFSYATSDRMQNALLLLDMRLNLEVSYNDKSVLTAFKTEPILRKWQHYCHSYNDVQINSYYNGRLVAETFLSPTVPRGVNLNGTLILGQEQDSVSGGFNIYEGLRGSLAQLEIFPHRLAPEEVFKLYRCGDVNRLRVFSTDVNVMEFFDVQVQDEDIESFCGDQRSFVLLTNVDTIDLALKMCSVTGAEPFVPMTNFENEQLFERMLKKFDICYPYNKAWLAVRRNGASLSWIHLTRNSSIETAFIDEERNTMQTLKDCAVIGPVTTLWHLVECTSIQPDACIPCTYKGIPSLRLKGLCFNREELSFTYVYGYYNKKPYFYSLGGIIIYKVSFSEWVMFSVLKQEVVASIALSLGEFYPIGRKLWRVETQDLCQFRKFANVHITLTSCSLNEFTCDSGDCIPVENLCDGGAHCQDLSDENHCEIIFVPETYDSSSPPDVIHPLEIETELEIVRFLEVNDAAHWIHVEILVTLTWMDPRLYFVNLQDESHKNVLSDEERRMIWTPKFHFKTIHDGERALLREQIQIIKVSNPLDIKMNNHREDCTYPGSSGKLSYMLYYSGKFECSFNVVRYPFDTHNCTLSLESRTRGDEVVLVAAESSRNFSFVESVSAFTFDDVSQSVETTDAASTFRVTIHVARLSSVPLVTVMLPSCQMAVVVYSTLFIRPSLLQVRLPVTLSTLLMLVTLFKRSMKTLPKTAYVKVLDGWFLAVIGFVGLVTLAHVASEVLNQRGHDASVVNFESSDNDSVFAVTKQRRKASRAADKRSQKVLMKVRFWILPPVVIVIMIFIWIMSSDG